MYNIYKAQYSRLCPTELIALPPNAIHIKCYDFEGPMNPSGHFVP
jgi:hypothetical protein